VGALDGRRALVTGGGRGIGAAVARRLAREGAEVTVVARSRDEVEAVAAEIAGRAVVGDVLSVDLDDAGGPAYDVLVANAGVIGPVQPFAQTRYERWQRAVEVNLFGAVRLVHAVLPAMLSRGWGRIVTVSSGAASPPGMVRANAYSTSKAALDMFTVHLARELDGSGVTANAIRPGVVDTAMQVEMRALPERETGAEFRERFHGLHQRGELLDPQRSADFLVDAAVLADRNGAVLDIRG
jgi:NAD(P)-dependent dehydrogenase (short-subunit alcohol dehydrogenase family)